MDLAKKLSRGLSITGSTVVDEKHIFKTSIRSASDSSVDDTSGLPNVQQCHSHLLFLNALHNLRQDVSNRDGLFDLFDEDAGLHSKSDGGVENAAIEAIAEKRWAVYVTRAAKRFEAWWTSIARTSGSGRLKLGALFEFDESALLPLPSNGVNRMNTEDLPPLDVLMVWHSFMLNPRCYLEDCLRKGMLPMFHRGMPWEAITESIDPTTGIFQPGPRAMKGFEARVGFRWNNLEDAEKVEISCPSAALYNVPQHTVLAPWTTCGAWLRNGATLGQDTVNKRMELGDGFADRHFNVLCPECRYDIDHEGLRAAKFILDLATMTFPCQDANDTGMTPMPGTVLSKDGRAKGTQPFSPLNEGRTFPNRLLKAMFMMKDSPINKGEWEVTGKWRTMKQVRDDIERGLRSKQVLQLAAGGRMRTLREERMAIRRMMSRYWGNSSPFALDLVSAVIRQGSFVQKMHDIDWLRSPQMNDTLAHLCQKYVRFFRIMADYPLQMAVPTLDIDLAWHTHQLSPSRYFDYSIGTTAGILIDHDDKVAETVLSTAFSDTSKLYQKLYDEPYSLCLCWYCESVRAGHSSKIQRIFNRSTTTSAIDAALANAPTEPEKGPHISTHNAIRPVTDDATTYARQTREHARKLDEDYEKACKLARKSGRPVPVRKDRGQPDVSPYAYAPSLGFVPYYGPIYLSGAYVCDPSCANFTSGGQGNCAQGSCGGGVAAGACGGGAAGGAACAGGAGGGACGGGGGGCGGGGGGGGGCGGGGGS